jgi:hypothetical protein
LQKLFLQVYIVSEANRLREKAGFRVKGPKGKSGAEVRVEIAALTARMKPCSDISNGSQRVSPRPVKTHAEFAAFAARLKRNQSRCISRPLVSSRRDHQGAATPHKSQKTHFFWSRTKVIPFENIGLCRDSWDCPFALERKRFTLPAPRRARGFLPNTCAYRRSR